MKADAKNPYSCNSQPANCAVGNGSKVQCLIYKRKFFVSQDYFALCGVKDTHQLYENYWQVETVYNIFKKY